MENKKINLDIKIPKKLIPVFDESYDTKVIYGGRSSAKTATIIRYLIARAMRDKILILCCREFQASIERSTYAELRAFIYAYNLEEFFTVKHDKIVGVNGSEFIFLGLARDPYGLKGIPNIGICYIDEAETISNFSWEILIPTVEKNDNSELILSFNPRDSMSSTYVRFITKAHELSGKNLFIEINYPDNPYLSKKQLATILKLRETNYSLYEHIYLGKVLDMSEDVIFKGRFRIEEVDVKWNGRNWVYKGQAIAPLYGLDFGFSVHPMAIIEIFMLDEDTLYISREIYETGLLITKVPQRIKEIMPEALHDEFYGDNASPDKIAQLNHEGIRCIGATKGTGSVEAGVDWLLSKNIIIHPSCKNTIYEFYNYKYKVDKNSGKITRDIIKANDHACDAIRYGCYKLISANVFSYDNYESIF